MARLDRPRLLSWALIAVVLLTLSSCGSHHASGEPASEVLPDIVIGQPIRRSLVLACVTLEQAESVVRIHSEHGSDAAEKAFKESGCFVLSMNLVPRALISSRRIGERTISIVEITVQTGYVSRHVIYMITPNPVIVGIRV